MMSHVYFALKRYYEKNVRTDLSTFSHFLRVFGDDVERRTLAIGDVEKAIEEIC